MSVSLADVMSEMLINKSFKKSIRSRLSFFLFNFAEMYFFASLKKESIS
jgi:hypothetical protein